MANRSPLEKAMESLGEQTTPPVKKADPLEAAKAASNDIAMAQDQLMRLYKTLTNEPKVKVSLAPQYRPYFGNVMHVGLSGIPIFFPIDGRIYEVPKSYAAIIHQRRRAVDDMLMRKNRLSDVQRNFETYAGELKF